jgi:hypothetical protein
MVIIVPLAPYPSSLPSTIRRRLRGHRRRRVDVDPILYPLSLHPLPIDEPPRHETSFLRSPSHRPRRQYLPRSHPTRQRSCTAPTFDKPMTSSPAKARDLVIVIVVVVAEISPQYESYSMADGSVPRPLPPPDDDDTGAANDAGGRRAIVDVVRRAAQKDGRGAEQAAIVPTLRHSSSLLANVTATTAQARQRRHRRRRRRHRSAFPSYFAAAVTALLSFDAVVERRRLLCVVRRPTSSSISVRPRRGRNSRKGKAGIFDDVERHRRCDDAA